MTPKTIGIIAGLLGVAMVVDVIIHHTTGPEDATIFTKICFILFSVLLLGNFIAYSYVMIKDQIKKWFK